MDNIDNQLISNWNQNPEQQSLFGKELQGNLIQSHNIESHRTHSIELHEIHSLYTFGKHEKIKERSWPSFVPEKKEASIVHEVQLGISTIADFLERTKRQSVGPTSSRTHVQIARPIIYKKPIKNREPVHENKRNLNFIIINNFTRYESNLIELERKFNKGERFDSHSLQETDRIRSFALKTRALPEKSGYLLEKSRELLLNHFKICFDELQNKIKSEGILTIEDEREKMRLFYLEMAIKENDPRSLQELENEHQENIKEIEKLNNMGIALYHLERYEDAIKAFDEALKINPKFDRARHNKDFVIYYLERHEELMQKQKPMEWHEYKKQRRQRQPQAEIEVAPLSPSPQMINRFPDISLPGKIELGQQCILRVAVTRQPISKEMEDHLLKFEVRSGAENITVNVLVTAQDFDIIGGNYRSLVIPMEKDSEPIIFQMRPLSAGEKEVKVEFYQNTRYIGGLPVKTTVVMPAEAEVVGVRQMSTLGERLSIDMELPASNSAPNWPDLTLRIFQKSSDKIIYKYTFMLILSNRKIPIDVNGEFNIGGVSAREYMEGLYKKLGTITIGAELKSEDIDRERQYITKQLTSIGTDLYEKLPIKLKEIWDQSIRGKVRSIMIISDERWIPWEIIKPSHEETETETGKVKVVEDNFLCEDYLIARWITAQEDGLPPPPPSRIIISRGAIIAPGSDLPKVEIEAKFLKGLGNIIQVEPPSLEGVLKLLKEGGFSMIHFTGHGSFDPDESEQSIIYLQDNERLNSRDISGERKNFGRDRPFIFMNACQTARMGFLILRIGSWVEKFLKAKSSGFIGCSWEVDDDLACRFSKSFYGYLREGKTIGEAMKEARLDIKGEPDSTWLAYTLYADPFAKVVFT